MLLLRHAQSTWNAEGRWQGRSDPPLSELGIAEATAAAEAVARSQTAELDRVDAIVSSDLLRARQTADILAERLGWGGVALFPGLRERDVGEFTGLTRAEIESRWPGLLARIPLDPPGAEPIASVLVRAVATLHRVASLHPDGRVVAVTHGALIRTVERHLGIVEQGPPRNLTGRWIRVDGGRLLTGPRALLRPTPVATEPVAR